MNDLQPHQQRVVTEKEELDSKIKGLSGFLLTDAFLAVPEAEQQRLRTQLTIMQAYSYILYARIFHFRKGE